MSRWAEVSQAHYSRLQHEPADVAEDWTRDRPWFVWLPTILKYLARAGCKSGNSALSDLRKASAYLDRQMALEERRERGEQ